MRKICVIGNFGSKNSKLNGQTIKTEMMYNLLKENNEYCLNFLNSFNWRKRPLHLFLKTIKSARNNDIVIFMPAHKGVKIFLPLLTVFKSKNTKLVLCAIGAWLPDLLYKNKRLIKYAKKIDEFWVETNSMIDNLAKLGLSKAFIVNNFKNLTPCSEIKPYDMSTYNFCIYSRINAMKGVLDAIWAVDTLKRENYDIHLDIYGPIEEDFFEKFKKAIGDKKDLISYLGTIAPLNSTQILSNYFMLLFPTRYVTEGIPGTIIDAFFAGLPILTSEYYNSREIMNENVAVFFRFCDKDDLKNKIKWCIDNKQTIDLKRKKCLDESIKFSKEYASKIIFGRIKKL